MIGFVPLSDFVQGLRPGRYFPGPGFAIKAITHHHVLEYRNSLQKSPRKKPKMYYDQEASRYMERAGVEGDPPCQTLQAGSIQAESQAE